MIEVRYIDPRSKAERSLDGRVGALKSWENTKDRTARTANGRKAFERKFLYEAGGDPKRAELLRKLYYAKLAQASVKARRRRGGTK